MKEFKDKVAVITGAASGIGRAVAERCAKEGMKVVLAGINVSNLAQAESELKSAGAENVLSVRTDVSKASDVEALAQKTLAAFGAVHLLFNNAGVHAGTWIWESSLADWEWVMRVNLWGVIHGIKTFVPIMLAQNDESYIVNNASNAGLSAYSGSGIYNASKHAVVSLSETLFLELQQINARVKVSVLCTGGVHTRIGEADRNRPTTAPKIEETHPGPDDDELSQRFWYRAMVEDALQPGQVADALFAAIREERFYILTHPQYKLGIQTRMEDILAGRNPTDLKSLA